jgi:para-nitrobenzyl esterase
VATFFAVWRYFAFLCYKVVRKGSTLMDVIVETTAGKIQGATIKSIQSFKGIPYGASTTGHNRFRPSIKPEPWIGIRPALEYGSRSPQPARGMSTLQELIGTPRDTDSEDCLFVNVWTPGTGDGKKRPVMFWCHGGGFTMGSGAGLLYNGTNLAQRGDVVIVTVNHRLGPLGYCYLADLAGEEFADSGNVGMLDIVDALKWVHENIAAFGGDPGNVTIFGESGGGGKVSALLAMPAAAGLFQRAIVQSGPGIRMSTRARATAVADKLLHALGISTQEVGRLDTLPIEQILAANAKINDNPLMGWRPVVDGHALPDNPFDPVAPAISANVPLLIGTNKDESTLFMLTDTEIGSLSEERLHVRAQQLVGDASDRLISAYKHEHPEFSPGDVLSLLVSDRLMRIHSITQAERKYEQNAAPAFMYLFTWETPALNGRLKSCHALEIPFVFDNLEYTGKFTGNGPERAAISEKMSEAWLAFARDGVPGSSWPAYDPDTRSTMVFNVETRVESDPGGEVRRAWTDVPILGISE